MSALTTPFGFSNTATEVARGIDLTGRRAMVTGASSGLGAATAHALAGAGAEVTLAVRDMTAGERERPSVCAGEQRGRHGLPREAGVLFAVEATRRWAGDNITANVLMPGAI